MLSDSVEFDRKGKHMLRISNIKISAEYELTDEVLKAAVEKSLRANGVKNIKIVRQSVDARNKSRVVHMLTLDFDIYKEKRFLKHKNISIPKNDMYEPKTCANKEFRPLVAGFGPAGMFCALALAEMGMKPVVIERGKCVEDRQKDVETFWKSGKLDTSSNVQFGEGGAGTFSDGKLTTGINDIRCAYILKRFVEFGAPERIEYLAKPHIGTDNLVNVVRNIRKRIEELGGRVMFSHRLKDIGLKNNRLEYALAESPDGEIRIDCDALVLAVGHSARDTFEMLKSKNFAMERKPFAMGVRIEHRQEDIDRAQYGDFAKYLPAADYKLTAHLENGRTAYSFCMCPGGVVAAAASEEGGVVTNGMSYFARDGENANAALLVNVAPEDVEGDDVLGGVYLQRELEKRAFEAGGSDYAAPVQKVGDLLEDRASEALGRVKPTYSPNVRPSDMRLVFPDFIYESLKEGILAMDKKLKGFADADAVVTAVESRSSSPVRIIRDKESFESLMYRGIYPCGEGCGYAGGIMSAAADGLKIAEKIAEAADNR